MIERDITHLRFLQTRTMKGEMLDSSDLDFIIAKQAELSSILTNINEMMDIIRQIENQR